MSEEVMGPRIGSGKAAELERVDLDQLKAGDRTIFIQLMADLAACAPSDDVIRKWAAKNPDRYFYSMKLVAGMMGLAEKVEYKGTIIHAIASMSDAELLKKLDELKHPTSHKMIDGQKPA